MSVVAAPVSVLLARLAGLLESARLEARHEAAPATAERIEKAQELLTQIMEG